MLHRYRWVLIEVSVSEYTITSNASLIAVASRWDWKPDQHNSAELGRAAVLTRCTFPLHKECPTNITVHHHIKMANRFTTISRNTVLVLCSLYKIQIIFPLKTYGVKTSCFMYIRSPFITLNDDTKRTKYKFFLHLTWFVY